MAIDINSIRNDFPILEQNVNGQPLVYLDNAATSQKPQSVIDALVKYYSEYNANIHRGVHTLSQQATDAYEQVREKVHTHFGLNDDYAVIFTSGTTDSINIISQGMTPYFRDKDQIIISEIDHHSNIVPWHLVGHQVDVQFEALSCQTDGSISVEELKAKINPNTAMIAVAHVSNALGTIHDIEHIAKIAQDHNIPLLVDGAQSVPHFNLPIADLGIDFFSFSAHKMYGPTGVGVLIAKKSYLQKFIPYKGGGEMISDVFVDKSTYADIPHKFEAGTPNIAGVIAFGAAIDYINSVGLDQIVAYENELLSYATQQLEQVEGLRIYGHHPNKVPVISFLIDGIHPYDLGAILDKMGVAVRTGHHCAQPLMRAYDIPGTVRASFAFYNTFQEVDRLVECITKAKTMLL